MPEQTRAQRAEALLRDYAKRYRETFALVFHEAMEGWPELQRKRILRFFQTETDPVYWLRLRERDELERAKLLEAERAGFAAPGSAAGFVGEGEQQLRQWLALQPEEAA